MPVEWAFPSEIVQLGGVGKSRIRREDAERQTETARTILARLQTQPGVLLADEVGMGKTFVAMAVAAAVIMATRRTHCPVVVMVPPGLRQKWQRDWEQFKTHCVRDQALHWVRDEYAHTPTEFFKLLDDPVDRRAHLIFISPGCFSRGLNDPWVKLAMIRLARSRTRLSDAHKRRLYWWAADLVRQFSNYRLTEKNRPATDGRIPVGVEAHPRGRKCPARERGRSGAETLAEKSPPDRLDLCVPGHPKIVRPAARICQPVVAQPGAG